MPNVNRYGGESFRVAAVQASSEYMDREATVEKTCRLVREAADETDTTVVVGVTERDPNTVGTLYNTNLVVGHEGDLLGKHRKLVPTHAEKLSWGRGDGERERSVDGEGSDRASHRPAE